MTKDELISKQQLEIEEFKEREKYNKEIVSSLNARFTNIGAPLNDNVLQFNNDQIKWALRTFELIESLTLSI